MRYEVKLTSQAIGQMEEIHKMPIKNFLVYYLIDEDRKVVWVTAVIYGRRDQIVALTDMSFDDTER